MITKLLLCCAVAAILGIATESSAEPYEVIKLEPISSSHHSSGDNYEIIEIGFDKSKHQHQHQHQPQHQPQHAQKNPCQQYMSYYDNFYKTEYSKYYDKYYKEYYDKYYNNYWNNHWRVRYANEQQIPNVNMGKAKVEWVCNNVKTKEQWLIGTQGDIQTPAGQVPLPIQHFPPIQGGRQPPQQTYPPVQYYPPQQGGQQPTQPPSNPQPQPSPPKYPNNPWLNPQGNPTTTPKPETETHNTNGEGIIDIRLKDN